MLFVQNKTKGIIVNKNRFTIVILFEFNKFELRIPNKVNKFIRNDKPILEIFNFTISF